MQTCCHMSSLVANSQMCGAFPHAMVMSMSFSYCQIFKHRNVLVWFPSNTFQLLLKFTWIPLSLYVEVFHFCGNKTCTFLSSERPCCAHAFSIDIQHIHVYTQPVLHFQVLKLLIKTQIQVRTTQLHTWTLICRVHTRNLIDSHATQYYTIHYTTRCLRKASSRRLIVLLY